MTTTMHTPEIATRNTTATLLMPGQFVLVIDGEQVNALLVDTWWNVEDHTVDCLLRLTADDGAQVEYERTWPAAAAAVRLEVSC